MLSSVHIFILFCQADTKFKFPEMFVKTDKKSPLEDLPADKKPEEFRWL